MNDYDEDEPLSLHDRFPWMRPIDQVPTLFRVLGTGTTMIGRRDHHAETNTYVSTHCFTLLFVPLLALGTYRVQDSPAGGWYFLGRENTSALAWTGNVLSVLLLLAALGAGGWYLRIGSAEHRAGQSVEQADQLAREGRVGEAATALREVMESRTTYVPVARKMLVALLDKPGTDPKEVGRLFSIAADLERQGDPLVHDLYARGHKLVADELAGKDPAAALEVLDIVLPLAPLASNSLQLEKQISQALVRKGPDDVSPASRLATVRWQLGETDGLKELLEPFAGKLGSLDGAAVLGRLYLRDGRYDDASGILGPFVQARLQGYRDAMRAQNTAFESLGKKLGAMIAERKAPEFDYAKFEAAGDDQKREMFFAYFQRLAEDDVHVRVSGHLLSRERLTMDAVLDLGLAQVHLAQQEADPARRKAGLEKAEATFRSIQDEARHNDEYRRRLAQVCYWLGKPDEGRRLLEELMTAHKRSARIVSNMADLLRGVGAVTEARKLVEDAHAQEKDPVAKQTLAMTRSLMPLDTDDRIAWLEKADPNSVEVKISLFKERGSKALEAGNDAEAAKLFRQAVEAYNGLGDNPAYANNAALTYFRLYDVTFDPETWDQGVRRMERAINDSPSDPIVVRNMADAYLGSVAAEAIGPALDPKAMRRRPGLDLLGHLYNDAAGYDRVIERLKANPKLTQVRGGYERLMVLAPRGPYAYVMLMGIYEMTGDREALKKLADRVEGLELDLGDVTRVTNERLDGKKDAQHRKEAEQSVARAEKALETARKAKGATLAAALVRLSGQLRALAVYGPAELDRAVKLAEEAHAEAPSEATRAALVSALLYRAMEKLAKDEPTFADLAKAGKRSLGSYLIQWALFGGGRPRARRCWRRRTCSGRWRSPPSRCGCCRSGGRRRRGRC